MRVFVLTLILLLANASAQTPPLKPGQVVVNPPAQIQAELHTAMLGEWTGVLEYRDYSEPDTSTKRVQLPTWLSVTGADMLTQHFVYDDGPGKVVDETLGIKLDVAASTFTISNGKGRVEVYQVLGYDGLHVGRGDLVISGPTTDNGRPVETRILLTVRRNLLAWTEENRATGTSPYVFRHRYVFTRAEAPKVTQH